MLPSWPTASPDASRPRPGVLTPSSDGSLNQLPQRSSSGMRQKGARDSSALEHLLKASIVVKQYPPNVLSKPCTLQPLMLLPREELALSLLDLAAPNGELPRSRLYESHVKILDLEDRMVEKPSVLIARNESSRALYAIERHDLKLFTVCKLGSWVEAASLATKATVAVTQLLDVHRSKPSQPRPAPLTTPHLHKEHKEKRLAIEALQSVVRKRGRSQSVSTFDDATRAEKRQRSDDDVSRPPTSHTVEPAPQPQLVRNDSEMGAIATDAQESSITDGPAATSGPPSQPTADDIYENIRIQYQEALYRSKGSLAYFAKGPLSRARAAFHLDCEGTLSMNDLVDFLKSLIMTTVQIDKKYRETIPGVISTLKTLVESSDEGTKSKKRKPKKMKLSKTGLYPHEENQVRRWWVANRPETTDDEVSISPAQMKSHVDLLRTRETQLQMILILEILALEPSRAREDDGESQLPGFGEDTQASKTTGAQPTKKRNKHNLPVLIEIHADRLCIWQSTASDEFRLLEDSQVATHPAQGQAAPKASADPLRDFCTDIIMPFFAQRLPELCDSINRKLGGPVIMPPPKPTQAKPSSSKHEAAKPGAATKRPAPPTRSKTIERALYKEQSRRSVSRGPGSTIALMRSATSAAIPGFKREASESSVLRDMAKAEPDELGERPRMLSRSSSLNAKEDNRAQKKAQVDAELKDAISALRRPNRELAGKSIVEAAERRTSGGLSHTRKSKKPTRHPLFQGVQVKATPANNRFRDALASESTESTLESSVIPPSSASIVPGTVRRSATRDFLSVLPSSAVKETPAKTPAYKRVERPDEPALPPSSPLMMRKPAGQGVSSFSGMVRSRAGPLRSPSPSGMRRIFETPIKARSSSMILPDDDCDDEIAATPIAKATPITKKKSIYERLGWDDDLDDL